MDSTKLSLKLLSDWQSAFSGTLMNLYGIDNASYGTAILVAVGAMGTIIRSDNEGASWTQITSNTRKILRDIDFTFVGEHGYIVGDSREISIIPLSIAEDTQSVLLTLSSSCTGNSIDVQFTNSSEYTMPVTLNLFDLYGRRVAEFGDYTVNPGDSNMQLSTPYIVNASTGLYFLTAVTENGILVDRVLLIR